MSEARVNGAARQTYGKAQEAVGDVIGDPMTKAKGSINQAAGAAESLTGQFIDIVREQPLTAMMIGVGVGYVMGRLRLL